MFTPPTLRGWVKKTAYLYVRMELQTGIVVIAFGLASYFLGKQLWRTFFPPKGSCGGACGCQSTVGNDPLQRFRKVVK